MAGENEFLLHALFMGIFITFVYDLLRIFRRVVPHGSFLVSLEDLAFWIYCAAKVFLLMYHEGNGTIRWFAVLGALAGMFLYSRLVSPWFVKYLSMALLKVCGFLWKAAGVLLGPAVRLNNFLRERAAKAAEKYAVKREKGRRRLKKKLTYYLRKLRMKLWVS